MKRLSKECWPITDICNFTYTFGRHKGSQIVYHEDHRFKCQNRSWDAKAMRGQKWRFFFSLAFIAHGCNSNDLELSCHPWCRWQFNPLSLYDQPLCMWKLAPLWSFGKKSSFQNKLRKSSGCKIEIPKLGQ